MAEREEVVLDNPDIAYEREDVSPKIIGLFGIATLVFLAAMPFVLMAGYSHTLGDVDRRLAVEPPAPVLQVDPRGDLAEFRAKEEARLSSYGWVDRGKGIVHIPIDRAMQEIAAKGIPDFPKARQ
jgi:hypothetical protein